MRVLFVSGPGIGHCFPLVPLAWAMRTAGHQVRFTTTGPGLAVRNAGLSVVDAAPDIDIFARMRERVTAMPGGPQQAATMRDMRDALPFLAGFSEVLVDGVVEAALRWEPDLIVHMPADGAGLVAAAKLDVPLVDHGLGVIRSPGVHEALRRHLAEAFARHGVASLPRRTASVDVAPPSLLDEAPSGWSMRYVPYNGGATLPAWLQAPPPRPRIAVSLGTVAPRVAGLAPVQHILGLAEHVDADFVLALGEIDTSELGELPDNVALVGWIPLGELLTKCAALIHHGGEGTTLTALATGTPQLILPDGAGRHIPAGAVARRGAGLTAQVSDVDVIVVERLVTDRTLAQAAGEVRDEIASLPAPADLVQRLADLARTA